jgi:hypothetical protein
MRWRTIRRETGLIEHVCLEHGVGHPNPGSVQYTTWRIQRLADKNASSELEDILASIPTEPYVDSAWCIHGCCGCCGSDDFPGTASNAIRNTIMSYLENGLEDKIEDLKENHFQLWWGILAALEESKDLER